jgi:hypothetical protein
MGEPALALQTLTRFLGGFAGAVGSWSSLDGLVHKHCIRADCSAFHGRHRAAIARVDPFSVWAAPLAHLTDP